MESSITLPSGIIVDAKKDSYNFYYKSLQPNLVKKTLKETRKETRKEKKYKCFLQIHIRTHDPPPYIYIANFDCKARGAGKGDGKFLLCEALQYLKTTLDFSDSTRVSLTAISAPGRNESERVVQDKLIAYYNRTYGFEVVSEDHLLRTDMATNLKTVLDKCSVPPPAAPVPKQTLRQRFANLFRTRKATTQ
jgi:hypothetical protein